MRTLHCFAVYEVKTRYSLQVRKGLPLMNSRDSMPHLLSWHFVLVFQFAERSPEISKVCMNKREKCTPVFFWEHWGSWLGNRPGCLSKPISLIPVGIGRNPGGAEPSYLILYFFLHFVSTFTFTIHATLFASKSLVSSVVFSTGWLWYLYSYSNVVYKHQ